MFGCGGFEKDELEMDGLVIIAIDRMEDIHVALRISS